MPRGGAGTSSVLMGRGEAQTLALDRVAAQHTAQRPGRRRNTLALLGLVQEPGRGLSQSVTWESARASWGGPTSGHSVVVGSIEWGWASGLRVSVLSRGILHPWPWATPGTAPRMAAGSQHLRASEEGTLVSSRAF